MATFVLDESTDEVMEVKVENREEALDVAPVLVAETIKQVPDKPKAERKRRTEYDNSLENGLIEKLEYYGAELYTRKDGNTSITINNRVAAYLDRNDVKPVVRFAGKTNNSDIRIKAYKTYVANGQWDLCKEEMMLESPEDVQLVLDILIN